MADDAKTAGAVVVSPRQRGRRPASRGKALVGVDVGGEEDRKLRRVGDVASEVVLENLGLAVECVPRLLPQARVHVARASDPAVVRLGHERDGTAVLMRHLFDAVLVDDVVVGHRQRVRKTEVDLLLSGPRLALGALDLDARGLHALADRADERFVVGGGQDVVVEDVGHRGRQVPVVLGVGLGVRLLEQEEFELGAEHRLIPEGSGALDLRPEHLAR